MNPSFGPSPEGEIEVEYWSHAEALKRDAANAAAAAAKAAPTWDGLPPLPNSRHWRRTPVGQMELLVNHANRSLRRALRVVDKMDLALASALPIIGIPQAGTAPAPASASARRTASTAATAHSAFSTELVTALVVNAGAVWQGVVLRMVILQEAVTAYLRVAEAHKLVQTAGQTRGAAPATAKGKKARPAPEEEINPISEVERTRRMRRVLNMSPEPEAWGYPPGTKLAYGDAPHTVRLMTPEEMETMTFTDSPSKIHRPEPEPGLEPARTAASNPEPEPEPAPDPKPAPPPKCNEVAFMETEPIRSNSNQPRTYSTENYRRPEKVLLFF